MRIADCVGSLRATLRRAVLSVILFASSEWVFAQTAQSTLHPAGVGAARIAALFWWMCAGLVVIWLAVMAIAVYASRKHRPPFDTKAGNYLIIGAGAVFPTLVLGALLTYSLTMLPDLRAADDVALRIEVSGERWWWRVRYPRETGEVIELANEIRLPVDQRVEFVLSSPDVIHSFWVPSLGGKMDMIPGRSTTIILEPTKPGYYRGVCAEYCGSAHTLMHFDVTVMPRDAFNTWLQHQAQTAAAPATALVRQGRDAFLANGCGACHRIRGIEANGRLGPDLTHVGSRPTLAAGALPNTPDNLARWIANSQHIKPGVLMPHFAMLPEQQLRALAAYLSELQ